MGVNEAAASLQPGSRVGDLQINAILGTGAFGVTYLVTDPAIGTRFALKEFLPHGLVVRSEDGTVQPRNEVSKQVFADGLKQFLTEARIVAALDHPHVVKVLRYFEANGTAYFLMPYYQGQPLNKLLEKGSTFDRDQARSLMLPLMDALEYIHGEGVVHQDIKPANIYMTGSGDPVLLDFGVAAAVRTKTALDPKLGSAGYAAPEQHSGGDSPRPGTDIYGLAATIYRCVTGKIPVAAKDRLAALAAGEADPLQPFPELAPATAYGGLTDAVDVGLKLAPQERPANVRTWKKSFSSLDWHHSIVVGARAGDYETERKEWLPTVLLGVFIAVMLGIGVFLLTDAPEQEQSAETTSGADTGSPAEPGRGMRVPEPEPEELKRWQGALKADTVLGYRRFMDDFPQSHYRPQAQTQLDILDEKLWSALSSENSIPAYEDYLDVFPDGIHQAEALRRIEAIQMLLARRERARLDRERRDDLAWEKASSQRTVNAFNRYIALWPAGKHVEEAQRIRRLLKDQSNDSKAFQTARKLNSRDAYQAYIDAFPKGDHVTAALQRIDDLTLRPGKKFRDCPDCPAMVVVPAATYWQGSDDSSALALSMEKPRRLVTIGKPFAVGVYEITMAQWDACYNDGGCSTLPGDNDWGRGNRPAIMVSWNDAEEFVHWLSQKTGQGYRLPSESEWEYVARAGEEGDWPGSDPAQICNYGNIAGAETGFRWQHAQCSDKLALGTAPVGSYAANAFGLHDTTGNVSEWTADCMNLSYIDAPVDGSAWGRGICSSHMTRGGSWITGTKEIRLPARFNLKNGDRNDFTGFRVVRDIED
jgi:formylglycine-generating enzyme required for sulfatase activity/serine/threonine protein kinase